MKSKGALWKMLLCGANNISTFNRMVGNAISWLCLLLVFLVCYDVAMRYLLNAGSVALQELEWHVFAVFFFLGGVYTLQNDGHARLDLLYAGRFSERQKDWCDLLGHLFFLIPFSLCILFASWPFVMQAWSHAEVSPDPGGLSYRWLIKAVIPVGCVLLIAEGIAQIIQKIERLRV